MALKDVSRRLLVLVLGAGLAVPGQALVLPTRTNDTAGIFDSSFGNRTIHFTSADLGTGVDSISKVVVTLDFMKCGDEPPGVVLQLVNGILPNVCPSFPPGAPVFDPSPNEISFELTSPSGKKVVLIAPDPNPTYFDPSEGGRIQITLDDAGSSLLGTGGFVSSGVDPFAPVVQQLVQLTGAVVGDWVLKVEDTAASSPLGFASFSLQVTVPDASPGQVPEPATLALLGLGLAGIGILRRRRS